MMVMDYENVLRRAACGFELPIVLSNLQILLFRIFDNQKSVGIYITFKTLF